MALDLIGSCGLHKGTDLRHAYALEARKVLRDQAALDDTCRRSRDHDAENRVHALKGFQQMTTEWKWCRRHRTPNK